MDALLEELSEAQREAVLHAGGPMLVVAGPGAGKTRVLTARVARMIAAGHARPEELLVLTFTRKAAAELRARLQQLLGEAAGRVTALTFHALAARLCPPSGPVLGEGDRQALLQQAAQGRVPLRRLEQALTLYKAHPDGAAARDLPEDLREAVAAYEALRRGLGALDLDDLLLAAVAALRGRPALPWRFVSIDEYQDCSPVQRELAIALGGGERNVFAIGDADQAIYAFRGADVAGFLQFAEDFPGARAVSLPHNYRATATLVSAAGAVIARNRQRPGGSMAAARPPGAPLVELCAPGEAAEAGLIAREIERLVGGTSLLSYDAGRATSHAAASYAFCDFAVLARTGARADALAAGLAQAGVPVQRPRRPLLDTEEARDLGAYLRVFQGGCAFAPPLLRVLTREAPAALPAVVREFAARGQGDLAPLLPAAARERVDVLRATLGALGDEERLEWLGRHLGTPAEVRAAALERPGALLGEDEGEHESDELDLRAERVSVLTLHGAKGLEFPVVFLAGCEAALLPGSDDQGEIEEERRLFYVGMTRARDRLYLSHAQRTARGEALPSPFLREVPAELLQPAARPAPRKRTGQMKLF